MIPGNQRQGNTIRCAACGQYNATSLSYCEHCGAALPINSRLSTMNTFGNTDLRTIPNRKPDVAPLSRGRCCPNCKHQHRPGELFCEICGADLTGAASAPNSLVSRQLQDYATLYDAFEPETQPVGKFTQSSRQQGTVAFNDQAFLQIEFNGFHEPLMLHIPSDRPLVFGRGTPSLGQIDIDLTPYNGHSQGISRHHAAVARQGKRLFLWDLGSTNGSYINGDRLQPNQQQQLRNGDEICLGQLAFTIYFHRNSVQ